MVGALSIVRFRTPIKDPMDLVFIFWAIVSGILCGAGFIPLVIIGAILIGLVLVVFANKLTIENPYLLVVKYTNDQTNESLQGLLKTSTKRFVLKSTSVSIGNEMEATYEIRVKENDARIMQDVQQLPGVVSAIMLSYDGNFTA